MDLTNVILPSPRSDFVELARTRTGRLFRKQILHLGDFQHPTSPGKKVQVTKDVAESLVRNFKDGHCDIVQVPVVNDANQHVEDPLRNLGEVVDVDYNDTGVYVTIDARKKEYADELGKTLIGASAMMHMDYTDTKTGEKVGPTLLHVAVTNRPYITNLDGFSEIVAASADDSGEPPVFLAAAEDNAPPSNEENKMDLDELLALLKTEHDIDVADLQAKVAEKASTKDDAKTDTKELVSALAAVLKESGALSLANTNTDEPEELEISDVAAAVIELSQEKLALSEAVASLQAKSDALELSAATAEVKRMVKVGRILPVQEAAMLELKLSNPEMFDKIVPAAPLIEMSTRGVDTHDEPESKAISAEIDRLAELANSSRSGRKK